MRRTCHLFIAAMSLIGKVGAAADGAGPSPPVDYGPVIAELRDLLPREMARLDIPCLSIALVDDQRVVWKAGFGFQDRDRKIPATEETVYRVGSISKLFTALAVLQLDEAKVLDIDAPIVRYAPEMTFEDPFSSREPITLRRLMSHRAGILRESPVGSYFDDSGPGIEATVKSIIGTRLVYPVGEKAKYSNLGPTVAGYIIEKVTGTPFAQHMERRVLGPLGMTSSSYLPDKEAVRRNLACAFMIDFEGRYFPAPTFSLGTLPAGNLYSSVTDLSRFLEMIFAGGKVGEATIVKPETLERMFTVQAAGQGSSFGLGFFVSRMWNRRVVSHTGAVYGFASAIFALPDEKLGVVVLNDVDCANGFNDKIVKTALRLLLRRKCQADVPPLPEPMKEGRADLEEYAGRYSAGNRDAWIAVKGGSLEIRFLGVLHPVLYTARDSALADDRLGYGLVFDFLRDETGRVSGFRSGDAQYKRVSAGSPTSEVPERFRKLVGQYGWPHNILKVYVKEGRLTCTVEWFFEYPLEEVGPLSYSFPDYGLYEGEKIEFIEDAAGRIVEARMATVPFRRLP